MTTINKDIFFHLETKLLKPDVRKSEEELDKILSESFFEFGSSGEIYNKEKTISIIRNQSDDETTIHNFKSVELSDGIVLVTYLLKSENKINGSYSFSNRSSIWKFENRNWKIVFHQGTKTNSNIKE